MKARDDIIIRPIKIEDAIFINMIRRAEGVKENTLGLVSDRLKKYRKIHF